MPGKPSLSVIHGGREKHIRIGVVEVTPGTRARPPFPVEIQVHAEDTWRILSADPVIRETVPEHPIRTMTGLIDDKPDEPGSVLRQGKRWLAIVYDLDQQPICREAWITQAMEKLLAMAARQGVRSLRLPLLGSEHGDLTWQRSLELICEAIGRAETGPKRIWLLVGREQMDECWTWIKAFAEGGLHR